MRIKFDVFDTGSIYKAIEKTVIAEHAIQNAVDLAIEDIMMMARVRLERELSDEGLGGSNLAKGIIMEKVGNGFTISANSDHVMFVEFGTGIAGMESPHPHIGILYGGDWEYDSNNHGMKGWWYPTTANDPNPTKKQSANGDWYAWTAGTRSRPVMYNTWLYVRRIGTSVFNKHLRRIR